MVAGAACLYLSRQVWVPSLLDHVNMMRYGTARSGRYGADTGADGDAVHLISIQAGSGGVPPVESRNGTSRQLRDAPHINGTGREPPQHELPDLEQGLPSSLALGAESAAAASHGTPHETSTPESVMHDAGSSSADNHVAQLASSVETEKEGIRGSGPSAASAAPIRAPTSFAGSSVSAPGPAASGAATNVELGRGAGSASIRNGS